MRQQDVIAGYVVGQRIGEGGMSTVYLADDARSGNTVVLKRLKDEFIVDPDFVTRFKQEAQIMGRLQHPNLARVLKYIEWQGACLLVEEYLPGGSLADRMNSGDRIPEHQALKWC